MPQRSASTCALPALPPSTGESLVNVAFWIGLIVEESFRYNACAAKGTCAVLLCKGAPSCALPAAVASTGQSAVAELAKRACDHAGAWLPETGSSTGMADALSIPHIDCPAWRSAALVYTAKALSRARKHWGLLTMWTARWRHR